VNKLSELLQKRFAASPQSKRAQNHADLLLRKDEILEQSQLGWSLRTIWNTLKDAGEITCAYSTFLNHIHRLQKSQSPPPKTELSTPKQRKEFTWDPTPNREELIG
jgi:hypothetical protein